MQLRDCVRTAANKLSPEGIALAARVADLTLPPNERIRHYEELVATEVGSTGLHRARGLERATGLQRLYLKIEGDNPSGTQKDRIAFVQVLQALREQRPGIGVATCGNYGVAVALAAQAAGMRCRVYLPQSYHSERTGEMEALGAEVHRLPGTYEDVVTSSSRLLREDAWADANPGPENARLQLAAYRSVGLEIAQGLRANGEHECPAWVALPVSNGTLLAGAGAGLREAYPSPSPRLLAGSSTHKNPITAALKRGLAVCEDLDPRRIHETATNEPLINWHAFDGQEALDAVRQSGGRGADVSDRRLKECAALLRRTEAYQALPASCAGLVGLLDLDAAERGKLHVAVLTARR